VVHKQPRSQRPNAILPFHYYAKFPYVLDRLNPFISHFASNTVVFVELNKKKKKIAARDLNKQNRESFSVVIETVSRHERNHVLLFLYDTFARRVQYVYRLQMF